MAENTFEKLANEAKDVHEFLDGDMLRNMQQKKQEDEKKEQKQRDEKQKKDEQQKEARIRDEQKQKDEAQFYQAEHGQNNLDNNSNFDNSVHSVGQGQNIHLQGASISRSPNKVDHQVQQQGSQNKEFMLNKVGMTDQANQVHALNSGHGKQALASSNTEKTNAMQNNNDLER